MRVLTIKQPWADLIMAGVKPVENRSWAVPSTLPQWGRCRQCSNRVPWSSRIDPARRPLHRDQAEEVHRRLPPNPPESCGPVEWAAGPYPFRLWVHASAAGDHGPHAHDAWTEFYALDTPGTVPERFGAIIGSVDVTDCHHADRCKHGDYSPSRYTVADFARGVEPRFCSPWAEPDVYHWTLADPRPLNTPIPARGMLGLWTPDVALAEQLEQNLGPSGVAQLAEPSAVNGGDA